MYPLGMTGAPKQNTGTEQTDRFDELELWIPHIKALGCNAIYIGPLFESTSHGYDTRDYKLVDRPTTVWAPTKTSVISFPSAMKMGSESS